MSKRFKILVKQQPKQPKQGFKLVKGYALANFNHNLGYYPHK